MAAGSSAVASGGWQDYQPQASAGDEGWQDYQAPQQAQPSLLSRMANQPTQFSRANPLRYFDELGQNMAKGVQQLEHPIDTAGKMYDYLANPPSGHDPSGDKPLLEGLGDVADTSVAAWGQMAPAAVAGKAGGALIDKVSDIPLGPKAKALGKVAAQDAFSRVPFAGRIVRRPSIMDYVNAAKTKAPTPPPSDVSYTPGYQTPRAYYGGRPPAPIPQRSGLELPGYVQKPFEGQYVDSPPQQTAEEAPFAPATEVQPRPAEPLPAPYSRTADQIIQDDLSGPGVNWNYGRVPQSSSLVRYTPPPQRLAEQIKTGSDVTPALKSKTPDYYSTDEKAWQRYPQAGSEQDLNETRDIQAQVREQAGREQYGRIARANEEGYARNTRPRTPKGELIKRVQGGRLADKIRQAPGSSSEEDLTDILQKSLNQVKARQ